MKFTLSFALDNADFSDDASAAIVTTLRRVARRIEESNMIANGAPRRCDGAVRDGNGNTVGTWRIR